ncbi:hypothetical protein [Planctomycetes bacterium K23_9]|uniref:DUF455 family protein n=1 Tax=Stieleria marina TaxID=1930275 RepID=A0A517NMR3_9BACT|nr:hypothetical protein K239x_03530 [Planctomycetes bacterium K23_9]
MTASVPPSYFGLPALAGLCEMNTAVDSDWSLDESVSRLKRLHFCLKRLHEAFVSRVTAEPIYELKTLFSHHAYLCAEQVTLLRSRVGEMREPPLGLDKVPCPALDQLLDEIICASTTVDFLIGTYGVAIPAVLSACERLMHDAHPLADAPTVRTAKLIRFELSEIVTIGTQAIACVRAHAAKEPGKTDDTQVYLESIVQAAGLIDGTQIETAPDLPPRRSSETAFQFQNEPQRDERFQDSFNAGVNPEAFLYDESFSARDKTLMMYYKRIREIDVPEMMASILVELRDEEPWEFHAEMTRQLWDEARHAMMGEVGFVANGIDWTEIPINFTWARNLNLQLDARQRHGVLFFIEQGLMPRTGKKYEWEVGVKSGDALSALFQDFDWADEVLHAQIGRRWYVPKFGSLNEAMQYGDDCWSQVLSHWQTYRDQGLTEHRNWWPQIYLQACQNWNTDPDPAALAFCETYADSRADLKKLP